MTTLLRRRIEVPIMQSFGKCMHLIFCSFDKLLFNLINWETLFYFCRSLGHPGSSRWRQEESEMWNRLCNICCFRYFEEKCTANEWFTKNKRNLKTGIYPQKNFAEVECNLEEDKNKCLNDKIKSNLWALSEKMEQ